MSENEIKGILGKKLGMTQVFDEDNRVVPVTVVEAGPCVVTQIRTTETDGYNAIQIAFGEIDPRKVNQPQAGHFKKAGVTPRRYVTEIRMDDVSGYEIGQEINAGIFDGDTYVDVTGTSKGHGFAGPMKRHGFAGQGASHGNQAAHRRIGSIGMAATPGHVLKGTRMAGRMGNNKVTTQNLKIQKIDADSNLILIKGAIPGAKGGVVTVKTAVKGGAHA
ncbi:50S ribosomal protein L3 [Corynebacterium maris DSM 45190]|uniref:Large ribosomal subunit protein uL3 n=1 Tax=Corynebacterium maris DSM 45190 TaxID=1224163 RepID=S5SSK8_9CORY|nr:50S ribosomal protein L3 [Corynebacterium maris]AGS33987.1 50S ribosomal protein L3 [Corynebacterium maris DSM 45190]